MAMSKTAVAPSDDNNASRSSAGYFADQCNSARDHKYALANFIVGRRMIESGQSVFLDGGTTVSSIMRRLVEGDQNDLNILTNNMEVFRTYEAHAGHLNRRRIVLRLSGGRYDQPHEALYGIEARASLKAFNPHLLVLATSGLKLAPVSHPTPGDYQFGPVSRSTPDEYQSTDGLYYHGGEDEGVIKETLMKHPTTHRLVVCDGTKVGRFDARSAGRLFQLWSNTQHLTFLTTLPDKETTPPVTDWHPAARAETCSRRPLPDLDRFLIEMQSVDAILAAAPEDVRLDFIVITPSGDIKSFWSTALKLEVLLAYDRKDSTLENWPTVKNYEFNLKCASAIEETGGRSIKTVGDAQYFALDSVVAAVEACSKLDQVAGHYKTELHIGIHAGRMDFRRKLQVSPGEQYDEVNRVTKAVECSERPYVILTSEAAAHFRQECPSRASAMESAGNECFRVSYCAAPG